MRYLACCLFSLLAFPPLLSGQPRWKLENIHGELGVGLGGSPGFGWTDLKKQSRDPFFPANIPDGLRPYHGLFDIRLSSLVSASATAGLYPFSKKWNDYNGRKEWQIGIFYNYVQLPGPKYNNAGRYPPADTVQYSFMDFKERRQYLGITNSITFRTNPERRVHIFGGAAVNVGIGIAGKIKVNSTKNISIRTSPGVYETAYGVEERSEYATYSAVLTSLRIFDGLGIRFLHHYFFSVKAGFDIGPIFYSHASNGGRGMIFESADLSIPIDFPLRKQRPG